MAVLFSCDCAWMRKPSGKQGLLLYFLGEEEAETMPVFCFCILRPLSDEWPFAVELFSAFSLVDLKSSFCRYDCIG